MPLLPCNPQCCRLLASLGLALAALCGFGQTLAAQDIWEYSPYKVCVWVELDPSLDTSPAAGKELVSAMLQRLESSFGAAWRITHQPTPHQLSALVRRGPEKIEIDDLSSSDLVLVLGKEDASTKTLRVLETAVEQLSQIAITRADRAMLEIESQPFADSEGESASAKQEKLVPALIAKCNQLVDSYDDIAAGFLEKKIAGALVPRAKLASLDAVARPVASSLPWHVERVLHDFEKLFIVRIARESEEYRVTARELDCPMRILGPTSQGATVSWKSLADVAAHSMIHAFAPVARIEEATPKVAKLRARAGGLVELPNPARFFPGDVLQPVLRREDRRGGSPLLEPIPWTFVAITSSDGITLEGNIYSSFNGVLQGKQTSRAQRVALKVRPSVDNTDIKVVVRTNTSEAQAGCQVYRRDLLTQELSLIGYTDWRGVITLAKPQDFGAILPESQRILRAEKRRAEEEAAAKAAEDEQAKRAAEKANEPKSDTANETEDSRGPTANREPQSETLALPSGGKPTSSTANASSPNAEADAELLAASVGLRQPLQLLFIKSGDTVLAKLPVVPGLNENEVAELPSDARRLEAEAVLRGFQGEILDLIAVRALFGARVKKLIAEARFKEAEEAVGEVRRLRDYKSMADILDGIQKRLLDETKEAIPLASKSKIDRMTQSTRDMLQKYLDNDFPQKLERDLRAAQGSPVEKKTEDR